MLPFIIKREVEEAIYRLAANDPSIKEFVFSN